MLSTALDSPPCLWPRLLAHLILGEIEQMRTLLCSSLSEELVADAACAIQAARTQESLALSELFDDFAVRVYSFSTRIRQRLTILMSSLQGTLATVNAGACASVKITQKRLRVALTVAGSSTMSDLDTLAKEELSALRDFMVALADAINAPPHLEQKICTVRALVSPKFDQGLTAGVTLKLNPRPLSLVNAENAKVDLRDATSKHATLREDRNHALRRINSLETVSRSGARGISLNMRDKLQRLQGLLNVRAVTHHTPTKPNITISALPTLPHTTKHTAQLIALSSTARILAFETAGIRESIQPASSVGRVERRLIGGTCYPSGNSVKPNVASQHSTRCDGSTP